MEFARGSYEESKEFKERWAAEFKQFRYATINHNLREFKRLICQKSRTKKIPVYILFCAWKQITIPLFKIPSLSLGWIGIWIYNPMWNLQYFLSREKTYFNNFSLNIKICFIGCWIQNDDVFIFWSLLQLCRAQGYSGEYGQADTKDELLRDRGGAEEYRHVTHPG